MTVFLNIPVNIKGGNTQGTDYVMRERPKRPIRDSHGFIQAAFLLTQGTQHQGRVTAVL